MKALQSCRPYKHRPLYVKYVWSNSSSYYNTTTTTTTSNNNNNNNNKNKNGNNNPIFTCHKMRSQREIRFTNRGHLKKLLLGPEVTRSDLSLYI